MDLTTLKQYLTQQLRVLHLENESTTDTLEQAVIEGGIIQLEQMWADLLKEDAPDKMTVLKRNVRNIN